MLKFCGGGQSVPATTSSGPELLVEFTTSPYGTFTGISSQLLPLYGFQLEVRLLYSRTMNSMEGGLISFLQIYCFQINLGPVFFAVLKLTIATKINII